jgi:choline dehydrogenase-like flavoprotein
VTLASLDPAAAPEIRFRMLEDERDELRLVDGLRRVFDLLADPRVVPWRTDVFMPNKAAAGRLATRTEANRIKAGAIDHAFATGGWLRRAVLGASVVRPEALRDDEPALRRIVRAATAHVHHVCGTCRMGTRDDALAVVDPRCRVYGVTGLSVADTSVMPGNISANTHLAAMMIGEKVAAMTLERA